MKNMDTSKNISLRIWDYNNDADKIDSFLLSASLAHKIPIKSREWFRWKFEESPYGKAVLACAFDGNQVVGCVGFGMGQMTYGVEDIKCALSYENFVHPQYQGCHIFTKLIKLAEIECQQQGVDILYNFPNHNSFPGYVKKGWVPKKISSYKIKLCNLVKCIRYFFDLKKGFIPLDSNLEHVRQYNIPAFCATREEGVFIPQWTNEYLKWRFQTFKVGNYWIYENGEVFAIARFGMRGHLKEAEILHIQGHQRAITKSDWKKVLKDLTQNTGVDFIGVSASLEHPISAFTKCFIPVPSKSHFTYKVLSDKIKIDDFKMYKCDIDAHTY